MQEEKIMEMLTTLQNTIIVMQRDIADLRKDVEKFKELSTSRTDLLFVDKASRQDLENLKAKVIKAFEVASQELKSA